MYWEQCDFFVFFKGGSVVLRSGAGEIFICRLSLLLTHCPEYKNVYKLSVDLVPSAGLFTVMRDASLGKWE